MRLSKEIHDSRTCEGLRMRFVFFFGLVEMNIFPGFGGGSPFGGGGGSGGDFFGVGSGFALPSQLFGGIFGSFDHTVNPVTGRVEKGLGTFGGVTQGAGGTVQNLGTGV